MIAVLHAVLSLLLIVAVHYRLTSRIRCARLAARIAINIAHDALEHGELGVQVACDLGMDDEEAGDELEWIAARRASLGNARRLVGLPVSDREAQS